MPLADRECQACGHTDVEIYSGLTETGPDFQYLVCPQCGEKQYMRCLGGFKTDQKVFHKPIEMMSLAVETDEEINRIREKCPDIEISSDPNSADYGIPIARTRKAKKQLLRSEGYVETN